MHASRRLIQRVLGLLWLLDGLLQLQPFMFGRGFADQILAPTADGQPSWISAPVHFFAGVIRTDPALLNAVFAAVQILIGVGLLIPRTLRLALAISIVWGGSVWWFGEGLGGLANAHASIITGAPGAVILYTLLAAAAWPRARPANQAVNTSPASWLPQAWAVIWVGGAVLQSLPARRGSHDLATQLAANADGAPAWLAATDRTASHLVAAGGPALLIALVLAMTAIGLAGLYSGFARRAATIAGVLLALVFWVAAQNLGGLYTGQATDPNSGPLLVLLGFAVANAATRPVRSPIAAYTRQPNRCQHASLAARG
ncbi:MAG: hypothetical protein M3Y44_06785 [Actinomycetota bacterium]|nr:hypothetical protein [Actinomycetota bacterium]